MRKNLFSQFLQRSRFLAVLGLLAALPLSLGAQSEKRTDPFKPLKDGNQRFVDDGHFRRMRDRAYREDDQRPYAVILSCSDSRVPPELVFGEWGSLGKLFVIRTAGNVIDPVALGSIEYAVASLEARLILVLGHETCGAVKAAREQAANPPTLVPPNVAWFLDPIKLAVERTRQGSETDTVKENVRVQIQNLRNQSTIIREFLTRGLSIGGGFYNISSELRTGMVDFL
jgi:carbonic anhydrase